jgi:hypothetical protein
VLAVTGYLPGKYPRVCGILRIPLIFLAERKLALRGWSEPNALERRSGAAAAGAEGVNRRPRRRPLALPARRPHQKGKRRSWPRVPQGATRHDEGEAGPRRPPPRGSSKPSTQGAIPPGAASSATPMPAQAGDRTGRPSITKTERPRSANLLQMPRGLMCKPRQGGQDYGGHCPAGSPGFDPSLQPLPFAAIARPHLYGRAGSQRSGREAKPQFRPRLSGFRHLVLRCSLACFAFVSGCEQQDDTTSIG